MMQKIKAQQKGSADEKQKITDISKRISTAWKNLKPDERAKWNHIANKDKVRFLEEKRNYKGPWQLPVKQGIVHHHQNTTERGASAFTEASKEQYSKKGDLVKSNSTNSFSSSTRIHSKKSTAFKLDRVSQEERDAAHNLVSLHMQSRRRSDSSNSFATTSSNTTTDSAETSDSESSSRTPSQMNKTMSWSLDNQNPANFIQNVPKPILPTTTSGSLRPMYHQVFSNNHMYRPEPMYLQYNDVRRMEASIHPSISAIGRVQKVLDNHPKYPPRRFNFARSP